ncbi:MAG: undecaprenyl-diphosphate phosphatase [Rhodospirillales bacterium]|nr:MAG: undecaprenyl-diphosphate phosphatase [Rhodospirillales bacterium]TVR97461.1 MAG: undecaprenyl-diphosphate phosphatase [Rhodospirillales bacterium]
MSYLEAAILGLVQGVFMFVPVSSTAHLVIAQHLLIQGGSSLPPPESPAMILFDLVVHVGTLVSIVYVFHRSLRQFTAATLQDTVALARQPKEWLDRRLSLRLALLGLLTVFVTGVIGLAFKSDFERVFAAPEAVAGTLAITGALLWWTDRLSPRTRGLRDIGFGIAITMGVAQGLSLIPGLSRSGMTIIAGLFMGLKRRWAAEFSFLVAIPTILAATLVQSIEVFRGTGMEGIGPGPLLVGFVVSAAVGIAALKLVLALLYRAKLKIFAFYLWGMAALVAFGALDGLL